MKFRRRTVLHVVQPCICHSYKKISNQLVKSHLNRKHRNCSPKLLYGPVSKFIVHLAQGYFKQAGLNVEANKFPGAQQVEGLIAGRVCLAAIVE